jgi:hypothetical protein
MALQVLRDPRPYLLAVIPVALIVIVPVIFAFITMMDRPFGTGTAPGSIVLWVVLGLAGVGLLVGLMVLLARATRLEELEHRGPEHETPDAGAHRTP